VPTRLLTLHEVADILRLPPRQVRLLAPGGADPLPLMVVFLAQTTLDTADGNAAATANDGGGRALGVAVTRRGRAR
jgi:hypothetical protein